MHYKILLRDMETHVTATLVANSSSRVESLSARIKVALQLPYTDYGCHRFIARGRAYVIDDRLVSEPEIRFECELYVGRYGSSEMTRLHHVFTTFGSAIMYEQDLPIGFRRVRCTLIERF